MAKLGDFTNPLSGSKGNVFNIGQMGSMIIGVVAMLAAFGIGTFLFNSAKRLAPGPLGGMLGQSNIFNPAAPPATVTSAGPAVTLWK